jgi:uncharacterized protein (TIGR02284 family)
MTVSSIITDLVNINQDRSNGFANAASQSAEEDVRSLFNDLAAQSLLFINELREYMKTKTELPSGETVASGTIYAQWADIKKKVESAERDQLLSWCQEMETAVYDAYMQVKKEMDIPDDFRAIVDKHGSAIQDKDGKIIKLMNPQPAR